jgi:hypothetical protein
MTTEGFPFAFDRRFVAPLRVLGVRPETSGVFVSDDSLRVVFGPWKIQTPLTNVADVAISGGLRWFRVVGPRLSLADRGVTFGTSAEQGACILLHEPVPALLGERLPHPGITVTVEAPRALKASIEQRLTT